MPQRRAFLPAALPVLIVLLCVCGLAAPPARAANVTVNVGGAGFSYSPATVTIQAGDSVTWVNQGGLHNVTADDGSFHCAQGCDGAGGNGNPSSALWTATRTFPQAGTFRYYCEQHGGPQGAGMSGTVVVQGGGGGGDTPGTLRFAQTASSISEGGGAATITVSRVNGDDGAASVTWRSQAGTATGADFTAGTGTLNWADHDDANKTFSVPIINDTAAEGSETVLLTLSNATGAALDDARKSATLTILDNGGGGGGTPAAPANLTATATSTSEITLAWRDVSGETGYLIERKALGGSYQQVGAVGANVTSFVAGGLDEATFYSFRVRAQNGAALSPFSNEAGAATDTLPAPCTPSATALCINNARFKVEVAWRTSNSQGDGQAVPLPSAPDSGLFYFFNSSNIEMLIKVLNACALTPPRYWVFYAATTNVEVRTTVTDTQTGKVKVYFNPLGSAAAPIQDVNAFATCP
jgi:plastocyanin